MPCQNMEMGNHVQHCYSSSTSYASKRLVDAFDKTNVSQIALIEGESLFLYRLALTFQCPYAAPEKEMEM